MRHHNYYVYILTNKIRTVLYTGVTNDLKVRLIQHQEGNDQFAFTNKYHCHYLVYYEYFQNIEHAIAREKEIKAGIERRKIL